jgi:hypothetical protein
VAALLLLQALNAERTGILQDRLQQTSACYEQQLQQERRNNRASVRALERQLQQEQDRHQEQLGSLRVQLQDVKGQEAARQAECQRLLAEREAGARQQQRQTEVNDSCQWLSKCCNCCSHGLGCEASGHCHSSSCRKQSVDCLEMYITMPDSTQGCTLQEAV